jgi:hypothetical protein
MRFYSIYQTRCLLSKRHSVLGIENFDSAKITEVVPKFLVFITILFGDVITDEIEGH